jgi:hypothetical protein
MRADFQWFDSFRRDIEYGYLGGDEAGNGH